MDVLLKTEPSEYSFDDLERDGETVWDGVTNPQAVKLLRELKAGAKAIIYHTGNERCAVGTARVLSVDAADPSPRQAKHRLAGGPNPKSPVVRIKAGKRLARPVPLSEIKANKLFAQSPLLRQGRLSVVPLSAEQFDFLLSRKG